MSRTEHVVGKLYLVEMSGSVEETCKNMLNAEGFSELGEYYKSWTELFEDQYYREYFIYDDKIYKMDIEDNDEDLDWAKASKNDNDSISFDLMWNNGGADMGEVLTYALETMDE